MLSIAQGIGRRSRVRFGSEDASPRSSRFLLLWALPFCLGLSACASRHVYQDAPADDYRAANDVLRRLKSDPGAGAADVAQDHLVTLGLDFAEQMTVEEALAYARYAVLDFESAEEQEQKRSALLEVMAQTELESRVTVKTRKPGAAVYYQLITEDESHQFGGSTPSGQSLPIGIYYIWTRRGGWQSSPRVAFRIVEPQVQITLPEGQTGVVYASSTSP